MAVARCGHESALDHVCCEEPEREAERDVREDVGARRRAADREEATDTGRAAGAVGQPKPHPVDVLGLLLAQRAAVEDL